jgi:hypothetical protein
VLFGDIKILACAINIKKDNFQFITKAVANILSIGVAATKNVIPLTLTKLLSQIFENAWQCPGQY